MVMRASSAAARKSTAPKPLKHLSALMRIAETMKKRVRVARKPTGETARERLYELMCEMGELYNGRTIGWKAHVARQLGMNYGTALHIIASGDAGDLRSVLPKTVDCAIAQTGIPPECFYDSEFRG